MAYVHAEQMGTVSQNSAQYYCFGRVTIIEQNTINNTTTFKAQLVHKHKSSAESVTLRTWKGKCISRFVRIDGNKHDLADITTVDATSWGTNRSNEFILAEYTETVSHDANGNKTVDLWMGCVANSGGSGPGTCRVKSNDYSWACPLPSLDRAAPGCDFNIQNTSTDGLQLNIWSGGAGVDWAQYRINDGPWIDCVLDSWITGLSPNTSYKIRTRLRKTSNQVWSESGDKWYSTHPNPVWISSLVATAIDPYTVVVTVSTNDPGNTANTWINCNGQEQVIAGGSGTVTFTVNPETTCNVSSWASTVRSGAVSGAQSTSTRTPADAYCYIIEPTGAISSKKKMYLIDTNGVKTEIKKEMVRLL